MIISQAAPHWIDQPIAWLTLVTLGIGLVTIFMRLGRKDRDIEQSVEQLERLRVIVEELAKAFASASLGSATNFARIEQEMRDIVRRIDRLEAGERMERKARVESQ